MLRTTEQVHGTATAYDVLRQRMSEIERAHEDYLYNSGQSIYTLVAAMAIELRDMVIERKHL